MIVTYVFNTEILEYLKKCFTVMTESNCAVVGEIALNKNVTVESSHFGNCKNTDSVE